MGSLFSIFYREEEQVAFAQDIQDQEEIYLHETCGTKAEVLQFQNCDASSEIPSPRRSARLAGQSPQYQIPQTRKRSLPDDPDRYFDPHGAVCPYVPSDPRGWSTDPRMLEDNEWVREGSDAQRLTARFGLTNCRSVLANNLLTIFKSNGDFYLWGRPVNYIQRITSGDFDEIKTILNNHGIGLLDRYFMKQAGSGGEYTLLPRGRFD